MVCCRSLGAGPEDVDGLTLTSIRSTTSSASKVIGKGWLPSAKLKPTFTFLGRDFAK